MVDLYRLSSGDKVWIGFYKNGEVIVRQEIISRVELSDAGLIVHTKTMYYNSDVTYYSRLRTNASHPRIIVKVKISAHTGAFTLLDQNGDLIGGIITTVFNLDFNKPLSQIDCDLYKALSALGVNPMKSSTCIAIKMYQIPPRVIKLMDLKFDEFTLYLPGLNSKLISFFSKNLHGSSIVSLLITQIIVIILGLISRLQMVPEKVIYRINDLTDNDNSPERQLADLVKEFEEITAIFKEPIVLAYFKDTLNNCQFSKEFIQALSWLMKPYLQTINTYLNGNIKNQLQNKITPESNGGIRGARPIMYRKCRATAAVGHLSNKARII